MTGYSLWARYNSGNGQFPFVKIQFSKNGRPIPVEGATYYLRPGAGNRTPIRVGKDLGAAHVAAINAESNPPRRETPVALEPLAPASPDGRKTIAYAVQEYDLVCDRKAKKTKASNMHDVREFVLGCKKTFVDEIRREDLLDYLTALTVQDLTKHNKLSRVVVWLNTQGIKGLLKTDDWPEYVLPDPDSYDAVELEKILDVKNPRYPLDSLKLQFCLMSGFRKGELIHAEFPDIDYRNCTVTTKPKPHWGWEPKKTSVKNRKKEMRTVRIPKVVVASIADLRKSVSNPDGLIFPNSVGKPDEHLLRVVQRTAKAAGITGRVGLHKFRRTFATLYAQKQPLTDVALMLGHKHLDQIQRYVAANKPKSDAQRESTEDVFAIVKPTNILAVAAGKS